MTRTATAHLKVNVTDDELVGHAQRLQATKQTWIELRDAVADFKVGPGVGQLSTALHKVAQGAQGLGVASKAIVEMSIASRNIQGEGLLAAARAAKAVGSMGTVDPRGLEAFKQFLDAASRTNPGTLSALMNMFASASLITPRTAGGLDALRKSIEGLAGVDIARLRDIGKILQDLSHTTGYMDGVGKVLQQQARDLRTIKDLSSKIQTIAERERVVHKKTNEELGKKKSNLKSLQQDFVRMSAVLFIMYHNARAFTQQLTNAAAQVDLMRNLTLSIDGFADKMEKAKKATQGTVAELEIMKSMALMSSFGISVENFDQQMLMVQKMARRTGQDTEYLMNSLATGVSRLSPMILDNLGLQISLSKSYNTYAAAVGKSASALTELEKKTAVMNEVMRQSAELTKEIDPGVSLTTRLERVTAMAKDAYRGLLSGVLTSIDSAVRGAESRTRDLAQVTSMAWREVSEGLGTYTMKLSDYVNLTLPEALNGTEKFIIGMAETLGMYERNLVLDKEQVEVMKQQSEQQMAVLNTSRAIYNALEGERKTWEKINKEVNSYNAGATGGRNLKGMAKAQFESSRAISEYMKIVKDMTTEEEARFRLSEKGVDLLTKALQYESTLGGQRGKNLGMVSQDVQAHAKGLDLLREQMKTQEGMFKDELHRQMTQQIFEEHVKKALLDQESIISRNVDALATGTKSITEMLADVQGIAELAKILADDRHRKFMIQHAFEKRALREQRDLIIDASNEAQGILPIQYKHAEVLKQLNEERTKYEEMQKLAIANGSTEAKYSTEQVIAQGQVVNQLQKQITLLNERNKYQALYVKFTKDVAWMSKAERERQAFILAGNKTRLQVEREMLALKAQIARKEESIMQLQKLQFQIQIWGVEHANRVALGFVKEAKEEAQRMMEALGKKYEDIQRFARSGGMGGGGRSAKDKGPRFADITKESFDGTVELYKRVTEAGIEVQTLAVAAGVHEMREIFVDGMWVTVQDVKSTWETLSTDLDLRKMFETTDAGGFTDRARLIKDATEKAIKEIDDFLVKMDGKLTDATEKQLAATLELMHARRKMAEEEVKHLDKVAGKIDAVGVAMQNAFGFSDMTRMFGRTFKNAMDEVTKSSQMFSDALKKQEYNTYDLVAASGPAFRGITSMFLESAKERATVEMILNVAQAWAAAAVLDAPGAIMHGTAAAMFGLVAGGVLRTPGGASSARKEKKDNSQKGGPLHIHLYGDSMATEGERARHIEQIMAEARAEGRV